MRATRGRVGRRAPRRSVAVGLACLALVAIGCGPADPSASVPPGPAGASAGPAASAGDPAATPTAIPAEGDAIRLLGPWLSVPLPAVMVGDTASRAEAACRSAMLTAGGSFEELLLRGVDRVIADARGEAGIWLVFANDTTAVDCRVALAEDLAIGEVGLRLWSDLAPPPADDGIAYVDYGYLEDVASGRTYALGRVGRQSVKVIATFRDESHAFASLGDGWFLVWWFGTTAPVGIGGTDAHHLTIAALAPPTPAPPTPAP